MLLEPFAFKHIYHLIFKESALLLWMKSKTPCKKLFNSKPSYDHINFVHEKSRTKDKFASRSKKCIFVGYAYGKKSWKVYDLKTNEIFISRDVVFH